MELNKEEIIEVLKNGFFVSLNKEKDISLVGSNEDSYIELLFGFESEGLWELNETGLDSALNKYSELITS